MFYDGFIHIFPTEIVLSFVALRFTIYSELMTNKSDRILAEI